MHKVKNFPTTQNLLTGGVIADVIEVHDGCATLVRHDGTDLVVDISVHGVPALCPDDRVVVQQISGLVCITHKLRNPAEPQPPTMQFDGTQWCLSSEQSLSFKVGKAQLTLQPSGDIEIEGVDISTEAQGINRILGTRIELN